MTPQALAIARPNGWARLKHLVLDTVSSPLSKRVYGHALDEFLTWFHAEPRPAGFAKSTVNAWRDQIAQRGLSASTQNTWLTAVRKLAAEAADNALLTPDVAAAISRVKGPRRHGVRLGNWLSLRQAQQLLNAPGTATMRGRRDTAILAVLLGCGLRRSEATALTLEHVQQREGRWVICDLIGKHGRVRSVPMPAWVYAAVSLWVSSSGISTGRVFRSINNRGQLGVGMTDVAVWQMVTTYAARTGLGAIRPHDLRRTCAKLSRASGGELEQIQMLLGHASIQTTERYLGTRQDLQHSPNDGIKLRISA